MGLFLKGGRGKEGKEDERRERRGMACKVASPAYLLDIN